MNEIEMALLRHEQRKHGTVVEKNEENNKASKIFSKILVSIIFLLCSVIYIKLSPDNLANFKKNIFESNFTFTKINNWYHDMFGNILPTVKEPSTTVSNPTNILEREPYLDGVKVNATSSSAVSALASGILVFMGEKEGYGNTMIIQGVDGVDIWYGGVTDTNLKLYDYIETNSILGNTKDNYYYLVFKSEDSYLSYEEYMAKISS